MKNKKFWEFKAKKDEKSTGELMLYGEIASSSWWGDEVTPKQFKEDLDALGDISTLNVFVNSPGGDVFAGQAIASIIKRHPAATVAYVDGLAASMASVIVCSCDKVIMPSNAMLMIHNAWTIAMGNANDFRKLADDLDKIGESLLAVYRNKTGMGDEELTALMDAETWMTAEDALASGFADEIEQEKKVAASLKNGVLFMAGVQMDLSKYKNAPQIEAEPEAEPEPDNPVSPALPVDIHAKLVQINERRMKL